MRNWNGALTGNTHIGGHKPNPISPKFLPPTISGKLSFSALALAGAIARTGLHGSAPYLMLFVWGLAAWPKVKWLTRGGDSFKLSSNFQSLSDVEKVNFAASVGAGITHLFMEALGYSWRENAATKIMSNTPHPDFIYEGGNTLGHGCVLAEAHGSFSKSVTAKLMKDRSKSKYNKQIKSHLNKNFWNLKVVHGYSIAFGSNPKTNKTFLHVSETDIVRQLGTQIASGGAAPGDPSASLSLATHRINFALMGASTVVQWIDWIRSPRERERPEPEIFSIFLQFLFEGKIFLEYIHPSSKVVLPEYFELPSMYAMEKESAERFLDSLSRGISATMDHTIREDDYQLPELETVNPVGFEIGRGDIGVDRLPSEVAYALFRDGLAVSQNFFTREEQRFRIWRPRTGISDE